MTTYTHDDHHTPGGPFWRSRTGVALLMFLAFAGVLLVFEHWAHLAGALPLLLPLLVCLVMHFFMHGDHGHSSTGKKK